MGQKGNGKLLILVLHVLCVDRGPEKGSDEREIVCVCDEMITKQDRFLPTYLHMKMQCMFCLGPSVRHAPYFVSRIQLHG